MQEGQEPDLHRDCDAVITLVHGTFAPHAPWTQKGSSFRDALGQSSNRLVVEPFTWGVGANNIVRRTEAAVRLRAHLERVHKKYLGAPQFVIAHSHGGNVALLANAAGPPASLSGIACLSTPFIVTRSRMIDRLAPGAIMWSGTAAFGFGIYLYQIIHPLSFLGMMGFLLVAGVIAGSFAVIIGVAMGAMASISQKVPLLMTPQLPPDTNLLIARLSGDEASLLLATGRAIWMLADRLYAATDIPENRVGWRRWFHPSPLRPSAFTIWMAASGFMLLQAVITGSRDPTLLQKTLLAVAMIWTMLSHTYLTSVFAAVSLVLFLCANMVSAMALGTSIPPHLLPMIRSRVLKRIVGTFLGFGLAMGLDVSTESSPLGAWSVHQFTGGTPMDQFAVKHLVHSSYDDPRVQKLVTEWIDATLERRARSVR